MIAKATSKYIRISPYKLRPLVAVVRGATIDKALATLNTVAMRRVTPIVKTIFSAYSNMRNMQPAENLLMENVVIKEIKVDQGPIVKYFKPGAMGRANIQRKRLSHVQVVVGKKG